MANAGASLSFHALNNIPRILELIPQNYEKALLKSAITVNNEVKKVLAGARSGRVYKIAGTRRTYRASSPSEPPAVRLGHLRSSYKYIVKGKGFLSVGFVGSNLEYSHYLEYGTSTMRPRKHLSLAFQRSKEKIMENFEKLI